MNHTARHLSRASIINIPRRDDSSLAHILSDVPSTSNTLSTLQQALPAMTPDNNDNDNDNDNDRQTGQAETAHSGAV